MKRFFLILFTCLLFCGCNKPLYKEIGLSDVQNKIKNKEDFSLFVGSTNCSHCDSYKVKLNKLIKKYKLEIFYIDVSTLTEKEKDILKDSVNYRATPTTTFFKDGVECDSIKKIVGDKDEPYIIEKFKNNGYIKEDA